MTLDDLATDWLARSITQLAAMPGLNNDLGAVQVEADIVAIKHPIFPRYSAGGETTGITVINGKHLAQITKHVEIRWKAFEVQRRCRAGDWSMTSRTCLLPNEPGVVTELKIVNDAGEPRDLSLQLLLSGRSRNNGPDGYAWDVPKVPTDVFSFTKNDGLDQTVTRSSLPDGVILTNDVGNAHATQCVWPAADRWSQERIPQWRRTLKPGASFTIALLCTFHVEQAQAEAIAARWYGDVDRIAAASRQRWETLWRAAFTPGNGLFSGSLPVLRSPHEAMNRIYYNGVLTLLTCRRVYPHALVRPCYITLWPRRGEGSAYMAWDLPYTSGIMARLDPVVLRQMLLLMMSAPPLDYQVTNYFTGTHGGWRCASQPHAVFATAMNLMRWAGDTRWQSAPVQVQGKTAAGFEAASQGQVTSAGAGNSGSATGLDIFREAVLAHRQHRLGDSALTSFGGREAYLECITTYAYGTAGHTAAHAWALQEAGPLLHETDRAEAQALRDAVVKLYRRGEGYFDCQYPDGRRVPAANLYDVGLVLNTIGSHLPAEVVHEIAEFARRDLITETWTHCLVPTDLDVLSGLRCDHQWAGCYPSWIGQLIIGLLRVGYHKPWMTRWLTGVAQVTGQGPFAQAYWAEDIYPPEAGGAAKCFDELTQGNHWVIGAGVYLAQMILDGVCGISADLQGHLSQSPTLTDWSRDTQLTNVSTAVETCDMINGRLTRPKPR